jgi:hypothetical protein
MVRRLPAAAARKVRASPGNYPEVIASQIARGVHAPGSTLRKLRVAPEFPILTHHLQMTVCQQPNRVKPSSPMRNRFPSWLFVQALNSKLSATITARLNALLTHEQKNLNLCVLCALCGEFRRNVTTEGTENTERHNRNRIQPQRLNRSRKNSSNVSFRGAPSGTGISSATRNLSFSWHSAELDSLFPSERQRKYPPICRTS